MRTYLLFISLFACSVLGVLMLNPLHSQGLPRQRKTGGRVDYLHPAAVDARVGETYYLAIGIGRYKHRGVESLDSPTHDARAMASALATAYPGKVQVLLNAQATRSRIKAALDNTAAVMTPRDYFVFYFSGHGGSDKSPDADDLQLDYLEPADSDPENYVHDISDTELAGWLEQFPNPQHITLILDSCHAGSFFHGGLAKSGQRWKYTASSGKGQPMQVPFTVLAASAPREVSVDADDGSVFTKYLLLGLTTDRALADTDSDHQISARELFNFAVPRTSRAARRFGEKQHPQFLPGTNPALGRY